MEKVGLPTRSIQKAVIAQHIIAIPNKREFQGFDDNEYHSENWDSIELVHIKYVQECIDKYYNARKRNDMAQD